MLPTMTEVEQLIARFGLQRLPAEGGWFARTWTGAIIPTDRGPCPAGTCILYLLTDVDFSALHRLQSDEVWHFHRGDAVELLRLDPATEKGGWTRLGSNFLAGEAPQAVVPAGWWQGARLAAGGKWALLGCMMAPGWDDADFELGARASLLAAFPRWTDAVSALTRAG
jgi:predicted cupin superfamily sugar epimerase